MCGEHAGTHFKAILDFVLISQKERKNPRYGSIKLKDPKSPVYDGYAIDAGTDMRSIFKWLKTVGADDFEPLENDVTLPLPTYCDPSVITPDMDANAADSKISAYAFGATDYDSICQAIYKNKVVLLLIKCDAGFWGTTTPTFTNPLYGHFIVADGYDENGIRIIDSAEPNDSYAVKMVNKQYLTTQFFLEGGTAIDLAPEEVQKLIQSIPTVTNDIVNAPVAPTVKIDLLTQVLAVLKSLASLLLPKVGASPQNMNNAFSLSKADAISVAKGLGIALAGAALTYLTSYISNTNFGVYTPVVVAGWSVIVNFVRKFVPNTATPSSAS